MSILPAPQWAELLIMQEGNQMHIYKHDRLLNGHWLARSSAAVHLA